MTRGRLALAVAGGVAGLAWLVSLGLRPATMEEGGALAPPFAAVTTDSTRAQRTLADYEGSPILLNVWATWCDPCREEMPGMEALYRDYASRGLKIVAISIDDPGSMDLIREFVAEHGLTFDILHDAQNRIMKEYAVLGVPQTFLITRSGRIMTTRFVQDWSSPQSRALVDELLLAG